MVTIPFQLINITSLVAQMVKCLPTMWEIQVQSLGWEVLLEKEMATHSSILAWKIPWTEKPGRLQSMGSQSRTQLRDFTHSLTHAISMMEHSSTLQLKFHIFLYYQIKSVSFFTHLIILVNFI